MKPLSWFGISISRFRDDKETVPIDPCDAGRTDDTLRRDVLMPVEQVLGMSASHVGIERSKPQMDVVFTVVNKTRRIVRHENIDPGKFREGVLHFRLFEQVVASRFVFPGAAKPSEGDAMNCVCAQVQVYDRSWELGAAIVVAFYGEDMLATATLCRAQDDIVRQIAARDENLRSCVR